MPVQYQGGCELRELSAWLSLLMSSVMQFRFNFKDHMKSFLVTIVVITRGAEKIDRRAIGHEQSSQTK
jgi:hypothetical protein